MVSARRLFLVVALACATGCATSGPPTRRPVGMSEARPPELAWGDWRRSGGQDDFQLTQRAAGVEEGARLKAGEDLERDDACELWDSLARTPTTLQSFGPRRTLFFVLREVIARGRDMPYAELLRRMLPFRVLVVMRPDGYLVGALTGRPLQRMGRVELREGRFMAGTFEVGAFYRDRGGVFYPVDSAQRVSGGLLGELGLEHDPLNAALDGAQDALGEMVLALAQLVTAPVRSIQGLQQLPAAVAALIASSPAYFARYSALPLQEQIREAARLSTHLLMMYGGAAGTAAHLSAVGATLPVLSLTTDGALFVEQVAVPVGATTAALGAGAGTVYVLMGAAKAPGEGAQGKTAGAVKEQGGRFKPFTERNFRENLARLTGQMPEGAHAHHVFPRTLEDDFRRAGINIHDPKFGAWWEQSAHLKNAAAYTAKWMEFFRTEHTLEEILQFARELSVEYGFQVNF